MRIILLQSVDPFANLAAERTLFETSDPDEEILLLYINRPCVVIGRSQNPYMETNLQLMLQHEMPLIRRYTGGGTVFHDYGNLNFSFIQPRYNYDKFENSHRIIRVLKNLGISAEVTERNDLVANKRKFSGSAYRLTKEKALHHGTMLISSDLSLLSSVLRPSFPGIAGKGVASVRSPVLCLNSIISGLSVELVINALMHDLSGGVWEEIPPNHHLYQQSSRLAEEFMSWEWIFGRTPRFSFDYVLENRTIRLHAENGKIIDSPFSGKKIDQLYSL